VKQTSLSGIKTRKRRLLLKMVSNKSVVVTWNGGAYWVEVNGLRFQADFKQAVELLRGKAKQEDRSIRPSLEDAYSTRQA
jgi:hypothetical protein